MDIDLIAIVDTETTGLDPTVDRVIEVACVLYSVKHACITETWSTLIWAEENPAEHVNHISAEVLRSYGWRYRPNEHLTKMVSLCSLWCAHRAEFDAGFLAQFCPEFSSRPMVCTKFDVEWPKCKIGSSLVETALAHGVPVFANHRAITDCLLLAQTFTACAKDGADLQAIFAKAMRPKAVFQALVSFEDKDLAKVAGFRWEPETRRWLRRMAIADAPGLGFPTRHVEEEKT